MLLVPLPFLVSLLLLVFLARLLLEGREAFGRNRLFVVLIGLYVVQTTLVGIRWGYGVTTVLPALPLLASFIPPLSFLAFRELAAEEGALSARDWPHLLPPLCVAAMLAGFRDPVDFVLIAEFAGYGLALLWLARLGPDGLVASRLDGTLRSYRSLQLTALALIGSAATDTAVSLDLLLAGGRHAPAVVSAATTFILLLLGIAAVTAGAEEADGAPETEPEAQAAPPLATSADAEVAAALDRLMQGQRLFADAGLNLGRLARRLGLPARAVSNAVNRVHGMSVSQYVNNFRVAEACRLLATTDMPVTRVVFEAGFMTKSNFNREFLRVTGMNPTAWRSAAPSSADSAPHLCRDLLPVRTGEGASGTAPAVPSPRLRGEG